MLVSTCGPPATVMIYIKSTPIWKSLLLPVFIFIFSSNIDAQKSLQDSSFLGKALDNTRYLYHQSFGSQSALFNGSKYMEYPFKFEEGHPFFFSTQPVAGSIHYDGLLYSPVIMRYDQRMGVLIVNGQYGPIQVLSDKVDSFRLYDADFIRLVKDSLTSSNIFYQQLYKGNAALLKKQVKTIKEVLLNVELKRNISVKDYYYIQKDNKIYPIESSNNLLKLFIDHKKEVELFIKANKLSFRKDRQNMLTNTTAYYNSLIK